jgi:hypothetical protein
MLLTTIVLEAWTERLPIEHLPQSSQDAIEVTRALGIRYLWIDALCILQDDPIDKKTNIERMGKYIKNSRVTIAAATVRGISEGFLSTRKLPPDLTTIPFLCPNGITGNISLAENLFVYRPEQPLDSRA